MFLIRVGGILLVLIGLMLVGVSGDNHSRPNGRHIAYGATLMVAGALIALFARQAGLMTGWVHP